MPSQLKLSIGQKSDKGRKDINQDFHGVAIREEPFYTSKGVAVALADGISSSEVSQIASEMTVRGLVDDYFCTSEAWTVKTSALKVLSATNSWLYSQGQKGQYRYDKDKGYVCTLSGLILKSTTAHVFHIGDSRIYRLRRNTVEQLTKDHRLWASEDESYLSRAMGIDLQVEIDYDALELEKDDIFLLMTDGVYEYASSTFIKSAIQENEADLDAAAEVIVNEAYKQGSTDNLTAQIIRVDELPSQEVDELHQQLTELPFPPILEARQSFDGYTIIREINASSRSHVYLAVDNTVIGTDRAPNVPVIIKTPSIDLHGDPAYLERFLMEDWIARRINSPYVLKPCLQTRKRSYLYVVTEYIEGQTLTQWMIDNPKPDMETVREITEQIAKGLLAFHRQEMLHQDLRPENIMIDSAGMVKIIDFGATKVAGLMEISSPIERDNILGTAQYTAPEYFIGEQGSSRSDLFSLGVITYQMLKGKLPYGAEVAKTRTKAAQRKLTYHSVLDDEREIPAWIDDTLKKAVHPNPYKRYDELSEFLYDLRQPNKAFLNKTRPPLMERDPVVFWQGTSALLVVIIIYLLSQA